MRVETGVILFSCLLLVSGVILFNGVIWWYIAFQLNNDHWIFQTESLQYDSLRKQNFSIITAKSISSWNCNWSEKKLYKPQGRIGCILQKLDFKLSQPKDQVLRKEILNLPNTGQLVNIDRKFTDSCFWAGALLLKFLGIRINIMT